MAIGRQDYQAGVVPIKSAYSLVQTPYFENKLTTVTAAADEGWSCPYTPTAGYQLNVTGFRVTTAWPGVQLLGLFIDDAVQVAYWYDSVFIDNFPDGSPLIVNGGELVRIKVFNNTDASVSYYCSMIGYVEQIKV